MALALDVAVPPYGATSFKLIVSPGDNAGSDPEVLAQPLGSSTEADGFKTPFRIQEMTEVAPELMSVKYNCSTPGGTDTAPTFSRET